jgi:hypothetical protein
MIWLSMQNTINFVEKFLAMVTKSNAEFTPLKSDNVVLKVQIFKPQDLLSI